MLPIRKLVLGKKGILPRYGLDVSQCQKKSFSSSHVNFENYKTLRDIKMELLKSLGTSTSYTTKPKPKVHLMKYMVNSQDELPVRKMRDSFDSAIVPLSTNLELRERYTTFLGHLRLGRLMEDIDLFAGFIAFKHILYPHIPKNSATPLLVVTAAIGSVNFTGDLEVSECTFFLERPTEKECAANVQNGLGLFVVYCCSKHLATSMTEDGQIPYTLVTVRVEHLDVLKDTYQASSDVRISGHVCWVGKTSFEVIVWLEQEIDKSWRRVTKALLLMAARNPENTGPAFVNRIVPETDKEKALFEGGEKRKEKRLLMKQKSLLREVPSEEELHIIHQLFKNSMESMDTFVDKRVLPPNSRWMADATLQNLVFCHPEYRNLHDKIFGGFLIRQALELSWSTAYLFGMRVPRLIHISDIVFFNPVDVGSLLKLHASVTYAFEKYIQVFVHADVSKGSSERKTTNSFHFTYDLGSPCDNLYPSTYLEAMRYIDGLRQFKSMLQLKEQQEADD